MIAKTKKPSLLDAARQAVRAPIAHNINALADAIKALGHEQDEKLETNCEDMAEGYREYARARDKVWTSAIAESLRIFGYNKITAPLTPDGIARMLSEVREAARTYQANVQANVQAKAAQVTSHMFKEISARWTLDQAVEAFRSTPSTETAAAVSRAVDAYSMITEWTKNEHLKEVKKYIDATPQPAKSVKEMFDKLTQDKAKPVMIDFLHRDLTALTLDAPPAQPTPPTEVSYKQTVITAAATQWLISHLAIRKVELLREKRTYLQTRETDITRFETLLADIERELAYINQIQDALS